MILTLDLGTKMGWAAGKPDRPQPAVSNEIVFKPRKLYPGERYFAFEHELIELLEQFDPKLVAYEEVKRWSSSAAAHVYGAFRGIMLKTLYQYDAKVIPIAPAAIKKFFTGNGRASKDDMVAEAVKRLSLDPSTKMSDNEADAIAMWYYARDTE